MLQLGPLPLVIVEAGHEDWQAKGREPSGAVENLSVCCCVDRATWPLPGVMFDAQTRFMCRGQRLKAGTWVGLAASYAATRDHQDEWFEDHRDGGNG